MRESRGPSRGGGVKTFGPHEKSDWNLAGGETL